MNKHVAIIGVVALALVASLWAVNASVMQTPRGQACTTEAKLCPDGSAVGRTGPNCEFAECPAVATTTTSGGGSILPYNSGVRGTVSLGPTCPVMRNPPDPQCADKGYQTAVIVSRASSPSKTVASVRSDTDGTFEISLPPGDYIVAAAGGQPLPRCAPVDASVGPTGYVTANISCDTGIR